ncbi:MAG: DNA-binding protein [Arcobacter sp.]|uniref:ORF6N domain-containing protein n=1 Tax=uncultured Arcobacter sp. TaxID=165434 RepID=UPI000CC4C276|nr:ORF6N domain-containing protein [uncultured Arcobacter sp.]PLY09082.1 MAG: DNA-binding protein [Arcobacter sp.]
MEKLAIEVINSKIYTICGEKVMLDSDLAKLYEVETKRLNEQVKRNIERFPIDFMFQLTEAEHEKLRSHFATTNFSMTRTLPFAFTEHGILMLSSVLRSKTAIEVNIQIMRTFTALRRYALTYDNLLKK